MSETPNDGAGPPERPSEEALRKMLCESMDKEPGLMRKIAHEALNRQDEIEKASGKADAQAQPSGAPDAPPEQQKRRFKAEVRQQTIPFPNATAAQQLREYLHQHEGEAIVFENNAVVLVRSRAFAIEEPAEEEKKDGPDETAGDRGVAPGDKPTDNDGGAPNGDGIEPPDPNAS